MDNIPHSSEYCINIPSDTTIRANQIAAAEKVLSDNGINPDEACVVLQALGFVLLDRDLYPEC